MELWQDVIDVTILPVAAHLAQRRGVAARPGQVGDQVTAQATQLSEVVSVGYGTQSRREVGLPIVPATTAEFLPQPPAQETAHEPRFRRDFRRPQLAR